MGGSHAGFVKNPTTFLRCEEVEKGEKTRKEIEEKLVMPSGSGVNTDDVRAMLFQRWSYDPEAYEVEEVKGVEITARRGKKTVGVFSTCMAISYMYTAMIIMQHFSYCTIMSICLFCRVL